MKKITERTYGTRLAGAQTLASVMAGFQNYKAPRPNATMEYLNSLVSSIQEANSASATSKQEWSLAVHERRQLLRDHDQSIVNLMTPLAAAIRSQYGRGSKEASDIASKVRRLRGTRSRKLSAQLPAGDAAKNAESTKRVSVSHKASGSLSQSFADTIAALSTLQPSYEAPMEAISIANLLQKHSQVISVNSKLASNYANWMRARLQRDEAYKKIGECMLLIKDAIKAQYGPRSAEYLLIKSISL